ncbi:hypothetical protein TREMEDRAFT_61809 [Tremella mesenterica DSM 1558]|uniref:uncharacterized protein n=1 Tax=Tremella mesenterica (strain ATCC 24925 / CBS 8224 / DSM 1558 / NBRC 9311 / NRRL Y-6157 / RJB 2259-6 / UBC 559-6) TaxID=578456 RepID=UPI0003F49205|nr:uncharacterized protein TREMEDRAFT_61809 [Tremella mesenterica DSM 1558]EIW70047.1 hypothetical protein TREMEDRAFT_61809 [Tremella mesenterica DSM 1558]
MPRSNHKQRMLRKIDHLIARILKNQPSQRLLRLCTTLRVYQQTIEEQRYYKRPAYRKDLPPSSIYSTCAEFYLINEAQHSHAFRITTAEMSRLDEMFGGDEVFRSVGTKPQAPSLYQLGLLVFRLAHGHDTATIARTFGISRGTVNQWTSRSLYAMCKRLKEVIRWPEPEERPRIKQHILDVHTIPHCLGFIDGIHINLDRAPAIGPASGSFHSRKERYGFNVLAAVDHRKRFTFLHWGFSARSSDMRLQQSMGPHLRPREYFDPGEFLLADSGFTCTTTIVPMYKRNQGELLLCHGRRTTIS